MSTKQMRQRDLSTFNFKRKVARLKKDGAWIRSSVSDHPPLRWGSAFSHDMKMYRTSQLKNGPSKAKM